MAEQISTKRLHLISNSKSGKGAGGSIAEIAQRVCDQNGWQLINHEIPDASEFDKIIDATVAAALSDGGTVVAAGGDGTIRAVAEKVQSKNITFAAIPCGTFNFFARTHSIPQDPEQAFRVALNGERRAVRLGEFNGRIFLINASFGLYAKAIREREANTKRWGRNQMVVIISTVISLLKGHRLMTIDMKADGVPKRIQTSMIFIGNNSLQLRDLSMNVAKCMKRDLLAVVMMKPLSLWQTFGLIFRGLRKALQHDEALDNFCVDSLKITTKKRQQMVALDGEIFKMTSPFQVDALPAALQLMKPTEQQKLEALELDRI
ncbi:MAG: NAD(+)/NADH kinase [Bdellovibrio sp.]|nr:NAD(+)/NADH kinase [Bdellovibrio sp.]